MIAERGGRPTWSPPSPYGAPESVHSAGMVVAPLLAGFTITLIGLVVDTSNKGIRHRDTALLILMGAVVALLAAIQCAYSARRYVVIPDEIEAWWPGLSNADDVGEAATASELRAEQRAHRLLHVWWADRFRLAYHLGILLVLAGLAVLLVPPDGKEPADDMTVVRWIAIALAVAGAVGEVLWIVAASLTSREGGRARLRALARLLMPVYDARLRDARAALALQRLAESIAAAKVKWHLVVLLHEAAQAVEEGSRDTARARMRCFKLLVAFESGRTGSGVSTATAREWTRAVEDISAGIA